MYIKDLKYKITIRLNEKELSSLKHIANERKTTLSDLLRYIIREYIRMYK